MDASWSTAAPRRVPATTLAEIAPDRDRFACVDTDAAALYACAAGRSTVVCLAHLDRATVTDGAEVSWGAGVGAEVLLAVGIAAAAALTPPRPAGRMPAAVEAMTGKPVGYRDPRTCGG